jgi:hypothetical protein
MLPELSSTYYTCHSSLSVLKCSQNPETGIDSMEIAQRFSLGFIAHNACPDELHRE